MSVTTREKYLEMGREHVGNDKEVERTKIIETDKVLNEHSAAWCSIWSTGKDHEHQDRVLHSKTSRSENRANLYLTHKDHKKEKEKTRPIGTANSSNTRAFANSISDLLESIANGGEEEKKYEVISSEDLLHHTKESNRRVREQRADVEEREKMKKSCWECKVWRRGCRRCAENRENKKYKEVEEQTSKSNITEILEEIMSEVEEMSRTPDCPECEVEKRKIMERDCYKCGRGVTKEENQFALVGMDAVALFPSLSGRTTARIIRKRVMESEVKCEGFNWKKAAVYIMANKHLVEKISKKTKKYFPIRKKAQGVTPGMNSKGLSYKENSEEMQWFYPRRNPEEEVVKEMIGLVAQIGVRVLWENYCYDFGGRTYIQGEGGPIGQRPTMAASRLVMEEFFHEYRRILEKAEVRIMMMKVYVDDGRQLTTLLRKGMRYNEEEKEFRWSMLAEEEDLELERQGEDRDSYMISMQI